MNKVKAFVYGSGAVLAAFVSLAATKAYAALDPAFVGTSIGSTTSDIGTGLTLSIPQILGIFAALTALGIAIHYVRKWIGRK